MWFPLQLINRREKQLGGTQCGAIAVLHKLAYKYLIKRSSAALKVTFLGRTKDLKQQVALRIPHSREFTSGARL